MKQKFTIHSDISKSETLPAHMYRNPEIFEQIKERIFTRTWQWIGDHQLLGPQTNVHPFFLLEHYLDEPLLLTRTKTGELQCLSNVCTHRGNIMIQHPGKYAHIRCGYHGRRFGLTGEFEFMPEFGQTEDFPRPCDHLPTFPIRSFGPWLFAGLEPAFDFQTVIDTMLERVGFLPLNQFTYAAERSKEYLVKAHWALYCDNYLEGFHIPFVHRDLNTAIKYEDYTTELYDFCNLQIGYADDDVECFELPEGHPDSGRNVAAYYYWIFPNMMFNFYPWGLSINIVRPLSLNRTKVSFLSYVYDESKLDLGAGADLEKVEREDEFVVENVHRGLQSRYYRAGRFSPTREKGVHHFHSLLASFLEE